jgi:pimeloyl-ACP methyl ester carboxylesterase
MKKRNIVLLVLGLCPVVLSLVMSILSTYSSFGSRNVSFESTYKEDKVTLNATYFEKKDAKYAVLICPGYSCDRAKWRPMANVFLSNGISVMTFDYSGQGASYGRIGFDNAKTDNIPREIDDALKYLHELSSIEYENIILMGHSMGGRSILRLLYDYNVESASTKLEKKNVKNVILFSPEVNYQHNAQASLFASTDDENDYPWKDYSPAAIRDTNIYLFGSTADDVVSDYDILRLSERLSGKTAVESGTTYFEETNSYGGKITVGVTSLVLHSYQMYSYRFADYLSKSISSITSVKSEYPSIFLTFVYFSWILALVGIFLVLFALSTSKEAESVTTMEELPVIEDTKSFLLRKLLLWIPGLLMGVAICCICVVLPFGSPVMNIPYMCCIAGYGIVMFLFYRKGRFKGTKGKLPKLSFKVRCTKKEAIECAAVSLGLILFTWFILKLTMYNLIPFNIRIFWLMFSTVLMTIGYYISNVEGDMLRKSNASKWTVLLYNLIQYVALFLFVLFYLVIRSYSGFIGQMQNLILMYVLTIPLGNFVSQKLHNRFYGALMSSFLFQAIMITSAAIIAIF